MKLTYSNFHLKEEFDYPTLIALQARETRKGAEKVVPNVKTKKPNNKPKNR